MDIETALRSLGGVAHLKPLERLGVSPIAVRTARRTGRVTLVRRGWVALTDAPTDVVSAVRVGGSLSCLSLLRRSDVWCVDDGRLHVRVGRHANHLASPDDRTVPLTAHSFASVKLERVPALAENAPLSAVDRVDDALMQMILCQPRDHAVAAIDSALHLGLTTIGRLRLHAAPLTDRHRDAVSLADASSASGLETKARLRLRGLRIPCRTQVHIPQVGHVDLLIGDRLVIELDGKEWHSTDAAFAEDRRRDLVLHEHSYLVIRLSYAQTMFDWERVERIIRERVARREHLWSARDLHRDAALRRSARGGEAVRGTYGRPSANVPPHTAHVG